MPSFEAKRLKFRVNELSRENSRLEFAIGGLRRSGSTPKIWSAAFRCDHMQVKTDRIRCDNGIVTTEPDVLGGGQLNLGVDLSRVMEKSSINPSSISSQNDQPDYHSPTGGFSWKVNFSLSGADLGRVEPTAFSLAGVQMDGELDFGGWLSGRNGTVNATKLDLAGVGIGLDTENGEVASESLNLSSNIEGTRTDSGLWTMESKLRLDSGAIYVDPLFIEVGKNPLLFQSRLTWHAAKHRLHLNSFALEQEEVVKVAGRAELSLGENIGVTEADWVFQSDRLGSFFSGYVKPFLAAAANGISPEGQLNARIVVEQEQLSSLRFGLSKIQLVDRENRFSLSNGAARINWARKGKRTPSTINWDNASLYSIPLGRTAMQMVLHKDQIDLLRALRFSIFDGSITLRSFAASLPKGNEPTIQLEASIDEISLDPLSQAFGWPAMDGKISGVIPGVKFQSGRLALDGTLRIEVFGGVINVSDLVVAGVLTGFPTLTADARIKDIDLALLTRKSSFGHMEGKIEGRVKGLYLENWKPVSFDAWLGTPASDRSRRRISQKAVENLSSLGSGSVTDVFSKGIMSFFDSFSYRRIGLGCRLQDGVCQLRGVSPAENGYYIVQGGGIPRIDVIGYNQQVDWDVLLERLKRISHTGGLEVR